LFFLILDCTWGEMHFLPLDIAPDIHQLIGYIHFLDDIEAFPRREIKRRTSFIITTNWF
jgi:hypothetical protein